jgi:hypothetical protein
LHPAVPQRERGDDARNTTRTSIGEGWGKPSQQMDMAGTVTLESLLMARIRKKEIKKD